MKLWEHWNVCGLTMLIGGLIIIGLCQLQIYLFSNTFYGITNTIQGNHTTCQITHVELYKVEPGLSYDRVQVRIPQGYLLYSDSWCCALGDRFPYVKTVNWTQDQYNEYNIHLRQKYPINQTRECGIWFWNLPYTYHQRFFIFPYPTELYPVWLLYLGHIMLGLSGFIFIISGLQYCFRKSSIDIDTASVTPDVLIEYQTLNIN